MADVAEDAQIRFLHRVFDLVGVAENPPCDAGYVLFGEDHHCLECRFVAFASGPSRRLDVDHECLGGHLFLAVSTSATGETGNSFTRRCPGTFRDTDRSRTCYAFANTTTGEAAMSSRALTGIVIFLSVGTVPTEAGDVTISVNSVR